MPALGQPLVMLFSIVAAFWWLHVPSLRPFSLQVFAGCILVYFALKFIRRHTLWHVLPVPGALEIALITFSSLLLIGSTGNLESPFFFITFIHLFAVVFAGRLSTSIVVTLGIVIFHYAMTPIVSLNQAIVLSSIPVMLVVFILIQLQHAQLKKEEEVADYATQALGELEQEEAEIATFLQLFLKPKLTLLQQLNQNASQNRAAIQGQITLIGLEIEKVLYRLTIKKRDA